MKRIFDSYSIAVLMSVTMVLLLIIGYLIVNITRTSEFSALYEGILSKVEYDISGDTAFVEEAWTLTFEDGQIYTVHYQSEKGFKIGVLYTVHKTYDKRKFKVRREKDE